jgi:hypothetical protein
VVDLGAVLCEQVVVDLEHTRGEAAVQVVRLGTHRGRRSREGSAGPPSASSSPLAVGERGHARDGRDRSIRTLLANKD